MKARILFSAVLFAGYSAAALAEAPFSSLVCLEKGYTQKKLEFKRVGDQVLVQLYEPGVRPNHPTVSRDNFEFVIPAQDCQGSAGSLVCDSEAGVLKSVTNYPFYKSVNFNKLTLNLAPYSGSKGHKGYKATLKVDGGDLTTAFEDTYVFETNVNGDSAFHTYCVVDGQTVLN